MINNSFKQKKRPIFIISVIIIIIIVALASNSSSYNYSFDKEYIVIKFPSINTEHTYKYKFYSQKYTEDKNNPYYGKTFIYVYLDDERYMNT